VLWKYFFGVKSVPKKDGIL